MRSEKGFILIGFRFLVFVIFAGLVLAMMPLLAIRKGDTHPAQSIGLALITGGGVGSLRRAGEGTDDRRSRWKPRRLRRGVRQKFGAVERNGKT